MLQDTTTAAQRLEGATVGLDVGDRYTHLSVWTRRARSSSAAGGTVRTYARSRLK